MQVHASVFKAYDIRGIVGRTIDEPFAEHLGRAFGSAALRSGRDARWRSGRDGRLSGPALVGGADPRARLDRARRRRPRRGDHADALLRGRDARGARLLAAASRSRAATTRRTTTASRWCWPAVPSTATRSRRLRRRIEARGLRAGAAAAARRWTSAAEYSRAHRERLPARAADAASSSIRGNGIAGATAPGVLRALGCEVQELYSRGRRQLPEPPSRPEPAGKPRRADRAACATSDAEIGLAFDGDGDRLGVVTKDGDDHLSRPPADAVRARRAVAPPRRADPLRRQVLAAPGAADPRRRRRAGDVEDRPLARQGEDEGARGAAGGRDERPHLLRRALVRFRRRHLHRGAAARDPEPQRRPERGAERAARRLQHARAQRRLRRGRAGRGRASPAGRSALPGRARDG